jgi:hypothetical protein
VSGVSKEKTKVKKMFLEVEALEVYKQQAYQE